MPTDFPGAVDDIQNDVTNSSALTDLHPSLHNDLADAVMALETQVLAGGGSVADGSITSAKIADGTIVAGDLADGAVTSAKILDGTIVAGDIADGAVTSAKIADGTIATADHADASVTNAKLASDTARANLLTNGGFEIWQRGNGPFTTNGTYCSDRWLIYLGGLTISINRDTANADSSPACAGVTVGGSGVGQIYQVLNDIYPHLAGKQVAVSTRVKGTATGLYVQLNAGAALNDSAHCTTSASFQTLSASVTMPATPTQLQVAFTFDAPGTYYIDNATLVVGSVAADYAPLHPADDLARCKRYYEILGGYNGALLRNWQAPGSGPESLQMFFAVTKAVSPTLTKVGTWTVVNTAQPTVGGGGVAGCYISGGAGGAGNAYYQCSGSTDYVSVEANP